MKYQLVLQWAASGIDSYDAMIATEEALFDGLSNDCEVDGHDQASRESNIFIFTNYPDKAFLKIKQILEDVGTMANVKIAYRDIDGDDYTILWPNSLTSFQVT